MRGLDRMRIIDRRAKPASPTGCAGWHDCCILATGNGAALRPATSRMFRSVTSSTAVLAGLSLLALSPPSPAASPSANPQAPISVDAGWIEAGIEHHSLSDGFGDWQGGYLRGIWKPDPADVINYELVDTKRFGETGAYGALGLTRTLNDRWYGTATLGVGDGAFFWPSWRVDVAINRKWLADRSLVTTLGYTHYQAPDGHVDRTGLLGIAWYARHHLVLEAGVRPNRSSPGGINSTAGFAAITWGEDGRQYLSLRHDRGREAYQTIGQDIQLVDFPSHVTAISWRRWVTRRCGFNLRVERYANANYARQGGDAGVFCGF